MITSISGPKSYYGKTLQTITETSLTWITCSTLRFKCLICPSVISWCLSLIDRTQNLHLSDHSIRFKSLGAHIRCFLTHCSRANLCVAMSNSLLQWTRPSNNHCMKFTFQCLLGEVFTDSHSLTAAIPIGFEPYFPWQDVTFVWGPFGLVFLS